MASLLPSLLKAIDRPFYQNENGSWWYSIGARLFGPYQTREDAVHSFQCEKFAPPVVLVEGVPA